MTAPQPTIAALSTAPAKAGIAVVRISGARAFEILDAIFLPSGAKRDASDGAAWQWIDRQLVYGTLYSTESLPIDRCMAVRFSAPKSYTGDDLCELHLHGSMAIVSAALDHIYARGARPAAAGEFTRRAFLAGKMGLADAEAVCALIDAESAEAATNAALQSDGALGRLCGEVYDTLLLPIARFRAICDYPEEDITPDDTAQICATLGAALDTLGALLERTSRADAFLSGVECAIVGRPNVGKSSIFNRLAGFERAIVTPIAGTTRDTLDARVNLGGVPLRLTDTAGLRDCAEGIEALGIERTAAAASRASLVLAVFDGSQPLCDEDLRVLDLARGARHCILLQNKCDIRKTARLDGAIWISAATGEGFGELAAAVGALYDKGSLQFDGTLLATARQRGLVTAAHTALRDCAAALDCGIAPDVALSDAERALGALAELIGRSASVDVVDAVFDKFCVGK